MKKQTKTPLLYRVPGRPLREDNLISKYVICEVRSAFGIENEHSPIAGGEVKLEQKENQT